MGWSGLFCVQPGKSGNLSQEASRSVGSALSSRSILNWFSWHGLSMGIFHVMEQFDTWNHTAGWVHQKIQKFQGLGHASFETVDETKAQKAIEPRYKPTLNLAPFSVSIKLSKGSPRQGLLCVSVSMIHWHPQNEDWWGFAHSVLMKLRTVSINLDDPIELVYYTSMFLVCKALQRRGI